MRCHVDIETYSEVDLKASGVYRYAEHESTELLCLCYRFGQKGAVTCWVPMDFLPRELVEKIKKRIPADVFVFSQLVPDDLQKHVESGDEVAAHNAQFERVVLNGVAGKRVRFPKLQINQMVCTAVKARTYGLPGALGDCAKALGSYPKDETGRGIMLKLCRPRSGQEKRYAIEDEVDDYVHLYAYCVDDVKAECGVDAAVPDVTPEELEVWRLDQRVNDRGVGVDLDAIADIQHLVAAFKADLEAICLREIKLKPSQREKIVDWVRGQGYRIPDMTADSVLKAQSDPNCPPRVKAILALYSTYGMKAPTKYNAIEEAVCLDSRIRGMMFYYGAGTGRWSSLIVQLQNLYRPKISDAETAIELFKQRDLDAVKWLYEPLDPMKVFASCVRGVLIPADGCDLIAMDYAGIESRVLAWMFEEMWKLEAFRAFDADKKNHADNYQIAYGNAFGVDPMTVKAFLRQIGKVMELALGYEGGVGAFVTMAPTYNVDLNVLADTAYDNLPEWALEAACWMWKNWECKHGRPSGLPERVYLTIDGIKQVWRSLHPRIKEGWRDTSDAAKLAVRNPGKAFAIPTRKVMFQTKDRWLHMRLPSGRTIKYFEPELHDGRSEDIKEREAAEDEIQLIAGLPPIDRSGDSLKRLNLTYMGVDSRTRQWKRESTYGGKLVENADQGISNCLLRKGLLRWDARGYWVTMSVHDEGICEVPEGFGSEKEAADLLCQLDPWACGLPVTAEGWRGKRYRKA